MTLLDELEAGQPMKNLIKKAGWWIDSVKGLKAHLAIHANMWELIRGIPFDDPRRVLVMKQLRDQETMVGHALLHVLVHYPIGSGRFWDDDDWASGPPSRYGFWFVTPNAHRCLVNARQQVRLALGSLRAAWRWQRKGV